MHEAAALDASPLVAAATPDRRFTVSSTPSPISGVAPWFPEEWDLWDPASTTRAGGYGVDAPRAWTRTYGSRNVVVAVLDTGITPHPDLVGVAKVPGYDFVSEIDGVETGDGDGWDADPSDPGDACAELDQDSSWHGTFVTGEIAAQRDRSGVVGQAPGITIEPVRVLGGCGGSEADTIAAIEWSSGGAVDGVPANQHPASVISMSLGSDTGACSDALQTAVDDAIDRGSVVVAAAGNDGTTMADTSPANCAGVVSVVATTRSGSLASYSNRGIERPRAVHRGAGRIGREPDHRRHLDLDRRLHEERQPRRDRHGRGHQHGDAAGDRRDRAAAVGASGARSLRRHAAPRRHRDPVPRGLQLHGDAVRSRHRERGRPGRCEARAAPREAGDHHRLRARRIAAGRERRAASRARLDHATAGCATARRSRRRPSRTYVVRAPDAGHRITVQVRASRSDALTSITTSSAKRVAR